MTVLLHVTGNPALAHELIRIDVVEPKRSEELPAGKPFKIVVHAKTQGQETGSTTFTIRIDSRYFDPRTGRLSSKEPTFGGERIATGQTKTLTAQAVEPGTHTMEVVYRAHLDESPTTTKREFSVAGSQKKGLLSIAGALILVTGIGIGLYLRKRKR